MKIGTPKKLAIIGNSLMADRRPRLQTITNYFRRQGYVFPTVCTSVALCQKVTDEFAQISSAEEDNKQSIEIFWRPEAASWCRKYSLFRSFAIDHFVVRGYNSQYTVRERYRTTTFERNDFWVLI